MSLVCTYLMFSALVFEVQDFPGLYVGATHEIHGQADVNFRQMDMNRDERVDLIFAHGVAFQRQGKFPTGKVTPFPKLNRYAEKDVFNGQVYVRSRNALTVWQWVEDQWKTVLEQAVDWQKPPTPESQRTALKGVYSRSGLTRYLFDIDQDTKPEILELTSEGLHIYKQRGETYRPLETLRVLPRLQVLPTLRNNLGSVVWPEKERYITFPVLQMNSDFALNGNRLVFSTRRQTSALNRNVHDISVYTLNMDTPDACTAEIERQTTTEELPRFVQACRLNKDDTIDFAGRNFSVNEQGQVPLPLVEVWASLDEGAHFEVRRAFILPGYGSQSLFRDFDGDGDDDMILEGARFLETGLKESLTKFVTSSRIDHVVQVYLQEDQGFSEKPAFKLQIPINIGAPLYTNSVACQQYLAGNLVCVEADLTGDKIVDIVVRDKLDRVTVYTGAHATSKREVAAHLDVPRGSSIKVRDINGDGRGDVIALWFAESKGETILNSRLFMAGEGAS